MSARHPRTTSNGFSQSRSRRAQKRASKPDITAYRPLVQSEYAVTVRDNKVLEGIREVGKQKFGGEYKRRRLETVKLDETKAIVLAYAERTNQQGNNKLRSQELLDPNNPRNRFTQNPIGRVTGGAIPTREAMTLRETRTVFPNAETPAQRLDGGRINAPDRGRDYIPALLNGGEFIISAPRTSAIGVRNLDALLKGQATVLTTEAIARQTRLIADLKRAAQRGGVFGPLFARLAANLERSLESPTPQRIDRFVAAASPLRRIAGGFVPPRDHYFPAPDSEEQDNRPRTASAYLRSAEGREAMGVSSSSESSKPLAPSANSGKDELRDELQKLHQVVNRLEKAVDRLASATGKLDSVKPGEIVGRGLRENPGAATDAVARGLRRRDNGSLELMDELGRGR